MSGLTLEGHWLPMPFTKTALSTPEMGLQQGGYIDISIL